MYFARKIKRFFIALLILAILCGLGYGAFCITTKLDYFKPEYEIKFDANGVSLDNDTIYSLKDGTIELPEPTRNGYEFMGWYDSDGNLWSSSKTVSKDTTLTAKWKPNKHKITFIIDGKETILNFDYDSLPKFPFTPTKESTNKHFSYEFVRWEPNIDIVKEDTTYTAIFNTYTTKYKIQAKTNIQNAGTISGTGEFEYNKSTTLNITENTGFLFDGWYLQDKLYSNEKSITIQNIENNLSFEAKFTLITYNITYENTKNCENNNKDSYTIIDDNFNLLNLSKTGYNFLGWFTQSNGNGVKISTINTSSAKNYTVFAHFELITYTISYNLNEGTLSSPNPTTYTIESPTFTLVNPTKEHYEFVGWIGTNLQTQTQTVSINNGSYGNRTFTANWSPKKYEITFIVDGIISTQNQSYGSMPSYGSTPTKQSSNEHTYFKFSHWQPELKTIDGNATYEAVFTENFKSYNVDLTSTHTKGGNLSGSGIYVYNSNVTISTSVNTGYNFLGWYSNNSLVSTNTSYTINNISSHMSFQAKFELINYTITYKNTKNATNSNKTSFTVETNNFSLSTLSVNGYTFKGWFTESNGSGEKITRITTSSPKDYILYAHFEIITYTITYNLNGGTVNISNPITYNIETATFTLNNPTKSDHIFTGWTGSNGTTPTLTITISKGSTGNRTYTANFQATNKTITFKVDNKVIKTMSAKPSSSISAPVINPEDYNMVGYSINNWYTDSNLTQKYTFNKMPENNLTLYGSWDYFLDEGFYPYLNEFNQASTTHTTEINSFDELVAFIEYIQFNYITDIYPFEIKYTTPSTTIVKKAIDESTYPVNSGGNYTTTFYKLSNNTKPTEGALTADPTKSQTYKQLDYLFARDFTPTRPTNNSTFNINNVNKTLTVTTSNQLVYALEKGLKPICANGSKAEDIYNKAKKVLNSICNDSMSDIDKTKAIYEWLILNVDYDHKALIYSSNWGNYDAWYAEGVFNNGTAVCDGIAKAFIILAKIENIPVVRSTGNEHAWNKVYVNNNWYGVDATHGDMGISNLRNSTLTYNNFLFTDSFKVSQGYTDTQYEELQATKTYNYYDEISYYYHAQEFDFVINSENELTLLLSYLKSNSSVSTTSTFEIIIGDDFAVTNITSTIQVIANQINYDLKIQGYILLDTVSNKQVYVFIVS